MDIKTSGGGVNPTTLGDFLFIVFDGSFPNTDGY